MINRRAFLQAAAVSAATATAQPDSHGAMLWDHIVGQMRRADGTRAKRLQSLKTPAQVHAMQRRVRARLEEMWGTLPAKRTPLNTRQTGVLERGDHVIEKVIYESRPSFFVTANVYRPKQVTGRLPAIVFPPGHTANGKAYDSYQRFCILMARNGFVVLALDCVGQGERVHLWDREKDAPLVGPGTAEHGVLGKPCYLLGINLMQYRVWDTIRGLDYLESRPDVDSERIGLAGQSGGGMETLQLAPFETRFKAVASVCAVASFLHKAEALRTGDPEQNLFGTLGYGIDHPELLSAAAPRPVLIGSAIRDFIPIEGARRTYAEIRPIFRLLGAFERASMAETDDEHSLNAEMRASLCRWFLRWLADGKVEVPEQPVQLPRDHELRCTATGQVITSLGGETVLSLNRQLADRIAPKRSIPQSAGEFETYRRQISGLIQQVTRLNMDGDEPGIVTPTKIYGDRGQTALLFAETGMDDPLVQKELVNPLIAGGFRVAGVDVRGWGETKPNPPGKKAGFAWDEFFAFRAMELGQTLFGQRLRDVLVAAPEASPGESWTAIGVGAAALLLAHAAVLDPRFSRIVLIRPLLSYRSLVDDPLYRQPFSSFLPGVIAAYEVRDLIAAIAPRAVLVINPENARRSPVDSATAQKELDWAAQSHRLANTTGFDVQCGVPSGQIGEAIRRWWNA